MAEPSGWDELVRANPDHSTWYVERFREMAAAGDDLDGEARFVDVIAPRAARVLDAGCGPGRVGGRLTPLGHTVIGVDGDPVLIAAAEQEHPGPTWLVGDQAELDLESNGMDLSFEVIVCTGNVMPFLAPSTRKDVLARMRVHLRENGRVVIGFGIGRGYEFDEFFADVNEVGLHLEAPFATWDMRPFTDDSDFVVAVFGRGADRAT